MPKFTDLSVASSVTGAGIIPVVINLSGTLTSQQATLSTLQTYILTGNAATATKLATGAAINGVTFDGSAPITINPTAATSTTLGGVIVPATATSGISNSSGTISLASASSTQLGAVKIDNSTITLNGSSQIQYLLPQATNIVLGGVTVDNTTITASSGTISVPTATSGALGVVKVDGTTIGISGGTISVPTATTSALGLVRADNSSITISSGVLTATYSYTLPAATASVLGGVIVQSAATSGLNNTSGSIVLAQATSVQLGGVKIGSGISVSGDGTISTTVYSLPTATDTVLGGVKVDGSTVIINSGIISANRPLATASTQGEVIIPAVGTSGLILGTGGTAGQISLTTATDSQLGGVKIDNSTIVINSGVISVPLFSANKIAIGNSAGLTSQGTNSIAIGYFAGKTNQANNTIILNASGSEINGVSAQVSSFYVNPVRSTTPAAGFVYYNSTTYEVTYSTSLGFPTSASAGGAQTQGTSRTTGVTLNKSTGQITLFTATGSVTPTTFTVTNSTVAAVDTVIVNCSSSTNTYLTFVTALGAGTFNITFYTTGGVASDTPVFNFTVIKGSNN
jgi:hypothetical protein